MNGEYGLAHTVFLSASISPPRSFEGGTAPPSDEMVSSFPTTESASSPTPGGQPAGGHQGTVSACGAENCWSCWGSEKLLSEKLLRWKLGSLMAVEKSSIRSKLGSIPMRVARVLKLPKSSASSAMTIDCRGKEKECLNSG